MESYLSVEGENTCETVTERSKFIAFCCGVSDDREAEAKLLAVKKAHSAATHNCYAYVLGPSDNVMRFSDDGEPSKTAGLPMLEVIRGRKLYKAMVIVTRYFGGIKLGTGGLVRAYGDSASKVLDKSVIKKFIYSAVFKIRTDYSFLAGMQRLATAANAELLEINYGEDILIGVVCPVNGYEILKRQIADMTCGRAEITYSGTKYHAYKQ